MGTCHGFTAQNFQTFDGLFVDFQGSCTYTISKYCGSDPNLVPYTIELKNQASSKPQLTHIEVYGHKITIARGEDAQITVGSFVCSVTIHNH